MSTLGQHRGVADELAKFLGPSKTLGAITRTFDLMGIAEERIAVARRRVQSWIPSKELFMSLFPPPQFMQLGDDIYAAHCDEIIARDITNARFDEPTRAEIVVALGATALISPLKTHHGYVADILVYELFPAKAPIDLERYESLRKDDSVTRCLEEITREMSKMEHIKARRNA